VVKSPLNVLEGACETQGSLVVKFPSKMTIRGVSVKLTGCLEVKFPSKMTIRGVSVKLTGCFRDFVFDLSNNKQPTTSNRKIYL